MATTTKQNLFLANARKKQNLFLANARNKQRVTLFLEPNLLTHSRAQAVVERCTLTALVEKALDKYLPEEIIIKKPEIEL